MSASTEGHRSLEPTDPRLLAWIEKIWPDRDRGSPVAVTLGGPPEGHVVAEQYAVLPHSRAVRFLVPLGSRPTSVAALRTYSAIRAPTSRWIRRSLAGAYRLGLGNHALQRLVVSVDSGFPASRWPEVLVLRHLAAELGRPDLLAFTAVRQINPNAKPTLELFDAAGAPVGYAKLGTTEATQAMVRTEASAMAAIAGRMPSVVTPRLLASGEWQDTVFSVGSPLPLHMTRWTRGPAETSMLEIARAGTTTHGPLTGSACAARLRSNLAAVAASDVARWLARWLDRLETDPSPLLFGRAHGDWIPDNMGQVDTGLAVWDWEHSTEDAPVGFDLLHWRFHHAFVARDLAAAVAAVEAATPELARVGVPQQSRELVASAFLLDLFVRRTKLATGGGGWNAKWYPDVVAVARRCSEG